MLYEVELKFRLSPSSGIVEQLASLGASGGQTDVQSDLYFRHPCRDFAQTDEALRIRRSGERNCLTYKGPRVDRQTKTRREIEIPFEPGRAEVLADLLAALGFREVATVEKRRCTFHLAWEGREIEVALDEVTQLGSFVEIETLADEGARDAARDSILRLADRLGLENAEPKTYLCLVLEKMGKEVVPGGRPR